MKSRDTYKDALYNYLLSRKDAIPPTVREICRATGIKSTSTVHRLLQKLRDEGLIEKQDNSSRAISLPSAEKPALVPLLGRVTAGLPILAVQEIEQYVPVNPELTRSGELFALRVRGDSMIGAGILDHDIIIVKRTAAAENGDIVVALLDDEATVKRFFKEQNGIRLQPENDSYAPIISDTVAILGKVVSLMRNYD